MGVSVEVESEGMDSISIYYLYVHIQFSNNKTWLKDLQLLFTLYFTNKKYKQVSVKVYQSNKI